MSRPVGGYAGSILLMLSAGYAYAQTVNPYHLNGSATQDNCNCYTLTTDRQTQSGSLWNENKIDLSKSFDFKFNVYLGCTDENGADGIAFVLQPISTKVGTTGEGLGYAGITPSVGIAIDTWQNSNNNDPVYDNISILKNGNVVHSATDDLALPLPVLVSEGNIEDCAFHTLRIIWNAQTKLLNTQIDGADRVQASVDLVKDIFQNDPMVFWGFTGATGGSTNVQKVCTSLNPSFTMLEAAPTCFPLPVVFKDSSFSFGTIEKWYWDFGDGTRDSVRDPVPHVFPKPGNYEVGLSILGNDGCITPPFVKTIVSGSRPVADYHYFPAQPCIGSTLLITDSSKVEFGTINKWSWSVAGQLYSSKDPGSVQLTGKNKVTLKVETQEGCISALLTDSIVIRPIPCPEFYVPNAFSPNKDGKNDRFEIVAAGMVSLEVFKVFNRYGQLLYSSTDPQSGWDGTFNGFDQPAGTYIWMVRGTDLAGIQHIKKGNLILIR